MPEGPNRLPELPNLTPPEHGPVGIETQREQPAPAPERTPIAGPVQTVIAPPVVMPITAAAPKVLNVTQAVEDILSEGMTETYKKMDPATQAKFRIEGERAANAISALVQSTKFQVNRVVELILNWLRIIPGVNKFFLEQEAKIKADKILSLRQPPV